MKSVSQSGTGTGVLPVLQFSPVSVIHQYSMLILVYMLPLPEIQTGEAWEPTKKQCFLRNLSIKIGI